MQATIEQQKKRISEQASEIAKLTSHLTNAEAAADDFLKEVQKCKSEQYKAKAEASRQASALAQAQRECQALDEAMNNMRDDAFQSVRAAQAELQREVKLREKQNQAAQVAIAKLNHELNVKDGEIVELQMENAEIKQLLEQARTEEEHSRSIARHSPLIPHSLPRQLAGKFAAEPYQSQLHRLEPPQVSKADTDRIVQLEKEVRRLSDMHAGQGCEEYQTAIFQQLGDALDTQKAAEAETEGLHHLTKMNEMLKKRREMDAERIIQLATGQGGGAVRTKLALSAVILQFETLPLAASMGRVELSDVQALATAPVVPQQAAFEFSDMQILFTDPVVPQVDPLTNVALTINIKPSEKRSWALLQHVQQAISTNSSLNINGPHQIVQQFVTEMEQAQKDYVEKASLAKQWEKVAAEHRAEADALREEVKQGRCGVPQHRDLALELRAREHELEAKDSQFQMHLLSQQEGSQGRFRG